MTIHQCVNRFNHKQTHTHRHANEKIHTTKHIDVHSGKKTLMLEQESKGKKNTHTRKKYEKNRRCIF